MQLRSRLLNSQYPRLLRDSASRHSARSRSALMVLLGVGLSSSPVLALGLSVSATTAVSEPVSLSQTNRHPLLLAQGFSPPDGRGMPGRREGGGTRGGILIQGTPPTALIPSSNLGTTLSGHPTFYFYVPIETAGLNAELVLLDNEGNTLYQAIAPLPSQEGIVRVPLPSDVTLEPERLYQWFFSVVVSEDDPSANIILSGWVRRVPENPELMQQLAAIAPSERPAAYADAGLWYEALNSLAELHQSNPTDPTVQSQWEALLRSVDLGAIAPQPLLPALPVAVTPAE